MKTDLSHIPKQKQDEILLITDIVKKHYDPHMIILFGSYARGNFVDIPGQYESDFDILLILGQSQKKNEKRKDELEKEVEANEKITTYVSFKYETLSAVNTEIDKHNYFFIDIKKEGIVLHNTGEYQLHEIKELSPKDRHEKAIKDFEFWINHSKGFHKGFHFSLKEKDYNIAAFNLHQSTEYLFMGLLLVHTTYKPKTHEIDLFIAYSARIDEQIKSIFPRKSASEKHHFNLLKRAYIEARYNKQYSITKDELLKLNEWVESFSNYVQNSCEEKIEELHKIAKKQL